ncbi:MAG: hypothetical protein KDC98_15100, partial [Planctomycetes bacterium]|nr:hypothetical protein [Planctomycetota bacterium]
RMIPGNFGNPDPGLVRAYRSSPPTVSTFGAPTSSGRDTVQSGMRDLAGAATRFTLSGTVPGAMALLALGFSDQQFMGLQLPIALSSFGFPGMVVRTSIENQVLAIAGSQGISAGYVQVDLPLTTAPTGTAVYAQWHWLDPEDFSMHGSTHGHAFRAR